VTPVIEREQADGVPVLRADGIAGRHAAALIFRVGRFDESLPASGITHMVEHLAFAGRPAARYPFNASVGGRYTTFYMESDDQADVADFVGAVCHGLTADAGAVLDRERTVLRTEAASRGGAGVLGPVLAERYGAVGPGIVNYHEFGLRHLGWADVADWRRRWFTAGNAVLAIVGERPAGLRVSLPDGPAVRSADPVPLPLALPGFTASGASGIGVSLVHPRTALTAHAAVQILRERLVQVLRHELGITYDVQSAVEELGPELRHTLIAADALAEQLPMAAHALLTELERLIDNGCDAAELDEVARKMRESLTGPGASWHVLQRAACDLLNGRTSRDPEESVRLTAGLEPGQVAAAARALRDQMIVSVPWAVPAVQGRMPALPAWSATTVSGSTLPSADSDATLTVGADGVTLTVEPSRHNPAHQVTVRYRELAALIRWKDGKQALVGTDGFSVQLDPDEWPDGARLIGNVAAMVPADRVITIDADVAPRAGRGSKNKANGSGGGGQAGGTPGSAAAQDAQRRRRKALRILWGARALFAAIAIGALAARGAITGIAVLSCLIAWLRLEFQYSKALRRAGRPWR
jgi:hypothetical protein